MIEDWLENRKNHLGRPEAQRKYVEYRMTGDLPIADRYMDGEVALHLHFPWRPAPVDGRTELQIPYLCTVFQRLDCSAGVLDLVPAWRRQGFVGAYERHGSGHVSRIELMPCSVDGPVLVDIIEVCQHVEAERKGRHGGSIIGYPNAGNPAVIGDESGQDWSVGFKGLGSPDGRVSVVVGLQFLNSCQIAAESQVLLKFAQRAAELRSVAVDREVNVFDFLRGNSLYKGDQPDHEIVETGSSIMNTVSDQEAPLWFDGLEVSNIEPIPSLVEIFVDGDAIVGRLPKFFNVDPQEIEVVVGPVEFGPCVATGAPLPQVELQQ